MKVRIFQNSVKFYLPRLEGYLETVRAIAEYVRKHVSG